MIDNEYLFEGPCFLCGVVMLWCCGVAFWCWRIWGLNVFVGSGLSRLVWLASLLSNRNSSFRRKTYANERTTIGQWVWTIHKVFGTEKEYSSSLERIYSNHTAYYSHKEFDSEKVPIYRIDSPRNAWNILTEFRTDKEYSFSLGSITAWYIHKEFG